MFSVKWCMVILTSTASFNLMAECSLNITSVSSNLSTTFGESTVTQILTTDSTKGINGTTKDVANLVTTSISAENRNNYPMSKKVRQLIVITDNVEKPHLRMPQGRKNKRRKKKHEAKVLLYREYQDDGSVLNTVEMKNMDEVAEFFKNYLDTTICYEECILEKE
ncbi:hypothetical protein O0L34_g16310 [Tuta absoluta]|nr:hypothetical protein O0L34_g16310 [Tuta absoluta]